MADEAEAGEVASEEEATVETSEEEAKEEEKAEEAPNVGAGTSLLDELDEDEKKD